MLHAPHRRSIVPVLAGVVATLLIAQVAIAGPPDTSGRVVRFTDVFAIVYVDEAEGLIALGGPPPEEGCLDMGFDDLADIMLVETAAGPIKVLFKQTELPIFVYDFTLGHPCDILAEGGTPVPLYVGTISTVGTDNDIEASLTRTNSFGFVSRGWVVDGAANRCRFSAHVRLQITRDGDFRVLKEAINIAC